MANEEDYEIFANFLGDITKVSTLSGIDGGFRVTIDIPCRCMEAVQLLMEAQSKNWLCAVAVAKKKGKANDTTSDLSDDF
jgi:hypothetical protein